MWAIPLATLAAALFADNAEQSNQEYSGAWRGSYRGRRRRPGEGYGSTRERESRYLSPTLLYGEAPCSLEASAYGANEDYGGHPIIDEIKRLNDLVLGIISKYVRAYQVGKISQLMSINKKRDNLIKSGASSQDPRVLELDDHARGIVNPLPADDALVRKIAWERDDLLRQAVSEGIPV